VADETARERPVHRADIVIVGAGAVGATAALEAHAAGASFVALDQLPEFGGTAIVSGGGCCIAGSSFQRARGIDDSPELALRDILSANGDQADAEWARFYLEHTARDLYDWLVANGVKFVDIKQQEHNTVPRWHQPDNSGRGIMEALWARLQEKGLADCFHQNMTAEDLIFEGDRVVGVLARDKDGEQHEFRGKAVVMGTGGFMANLDMVLEYGPQLRDVERVLVGGGVGAQGKGHRILERHGAVLTHMDNLWCYAYATPDYKDPSGRRGIVIRGLENCIWVTREGKRFHNERLTGAGSATPAILRQKPPTCWAIIDRGMFEGLEIADPYYRRGNTKFFDKMDELLRESPYIHEGNTPEELARNTGLDVEGFAKTLRDWNALVASGAEADPLTGRKLKGNRPLDQAPLYAIQFLPLARKNLGGVKTDLQCRVVRADGAVIPGLFAAGELCGMAGGHIAGKYALEGIMIGASLFSGRVAGAWAAHEAGYREPAHLDARRPVDEPVVVGAITSTPVVPAEATTPAQ
jgi:flavocytochrome c